MGRTEWLSEGAEKLAFEILSGAHCDVAVVGSGYGGAVAAARLAGATTENGSKRTANVWLLERGREYVPGAFPERFADLPGQVRISSGGDEPRTRGIAEGLFDMRLGKDVSALLGNGLGGGSLINAGVLARPSATVFNTGWPAEITAATLDSCFARVEARLQMEQVPPEKASAKFQALHDLGQRIDGRNADRRSNIAVTFHKKNDLGVPQVACIHCGDCFTGCNHWAKNTLAMNYLALAKKRGARLFTGITVLALEPANGGWKLNLKFTDPQIAKRFGGTEAPALHAARVILAAGTYGSTGILMRSARNGFKQLSRGRLGSKFSTNGDMIAVGYDMPKDINASAKETTPPKERCIGPTITGMIDLRGSPSPLVIEELAIPAALRRPFEEVVTTAAMLHGLAHMDRGLHTSDPGPDPAAINQDAIARTAVYATIGDDGAGGEMSLPCQSAALQCDDGVRVAWKGVGDLPVFKDAIKTLEEAHGKHGKVIPNPMWKLLPDSIGRVLATGEMGGAVFTVHPLGGCAMAESADEGVVNQLGQVFTGRTKTEVHPTLAVLDGSIVPTALGTNPCLTIAALAEYAVPQLGEAWKLTLLQDFDLGGPLPPLSKPSLSPGPKPRSTGIRLAERLTGNLSLPMWRKFQAQLRLQYEPVGDLESFLANLPKDLRIPEARLQLHGVVGSTNVSVTAELEGNLNLFVRENTTTWRRILRAGWAWFRNRGRRDLLQSREKPSPGSSERPGWRRMIRGWLAVASHAGEGRRLLYDLKVTRDVVVPADGRGRDICLLKAGDHLVGEKRLAYIGRPWFGRDRWPSPWDQLTKLPLFLQRPGRWWKTRLGLLDVDLPYFVQQYATQLQLAQQEDQPRAIADLYSLLAYLVRLIGKIHFWSFRAPDYPNPYPIYEFTAKALEAAKETTEEAKKEWVDRLDYRLPGEVDGLTRKPCAFRAGQTEGKMQVSLLGHSLALTTPLGEAKRDKKQPQSPPQIQLTRYLRDADKPDPALEPVLLIHGLGAGGNTFTVPELKQNLVQHLAKRGFDPWVLDLRTSIALESSKIPWSFEEAAFGDIPEAMNRVFAATGKPVNVVAHCIGAAMFCMAALAGKLQPGRVRAAVLSQVGPLLELPPANRFRGYVASYLKHYLDVDEFDVVSSLTPFNRFIDRLLAAYPYPKHEWRAHRPLSWKKVTHEAYCLRIYGIYGRLFEHRNLKHETLDLLGDYIGHMQYRTYQQTIFYATMRRLTSTLGRNDFVNHDNIVNHLNFPLCFVHGKSNDAFDVATSRRSFDLLASIFWSPDLAAIWSQSQPDRYDYAAYAKGKRLRILEIEGYGHQDCMIGKRAYKDVFPGISDFLRQNFPPEEQRQSGAPFFVVRPPRMGPVVGWIREAADNKKASGRGKMELLARILFVPNDSRSVPLYAMTIVLDGNQPVPRSARFHSLRDPTQEALTPPTQAIDVRLPDVGDCRIVLVTVHKEQYEPEPMRESGGPPTDDPFGEDLDRFPNLDKDMRFPADAASAKNMRPGDVDRFVLPVLDSCEDLGIGREPLAAGRRVSDSRYSTPVSIAILSPQVLAATRRGQPRERPLCFALASCRYAAAVADRELADEAFGRLRDRLERPQGRRVPQLLFLAGDTIYADATYGIFDPTLGVERYDQRYLEALTAPNAREVLRRLPTYPMLDDHEVEENFEGQGTGEQQVLGLKAFEAFQLLLTPAFKDPAKRALKRKGYWYGVSAGGSPFFVADTRTGRSRGAGLQSAHATILRDEQMRALKRWLAKSHKANAATPKFIVSPSVVAPWSRETRGERAYSLRSDAWDGFPDSLLDLLGFIADKNIGNVVFLSGDYHCSVFCTMRLARNGARPVEAYSIVSSGLYSPYPFANTRFEDLQIAFNGSYQKDWLGQSGSGDLFIDYQAEQIGTSASFAVVAVERRKAGGTWLAVECDTDRGVCLKEARLS